ncbi:hypothetical protein HPB50_008289 [Hyalomma asiaticum]|uniref:Uncharacterized protein n=1 Tax=Hyalomma asiaticum TaxID=266040 RepID=A0ACB7RSQ0_HYAAI|nr:hypothetical protein HPB50_008289 [Hyalomma asiaticum]
MAAADDHQTEAVPPPASEPWVLIQDDGASENEVLLKDQDADEVGEGQSVQHAADHQRSAQDTEMCNSAWNAATIRNALCGDKRLYILGVVLPVNTVLYFLGGVASLAEHATVQILLTSLRCFTQATLWAATFSCITRYLSLLLAKASKVKKREVKNLLPYVAATELVLVLLSCYACFYEVRAGIKIIQEAQRDWCFGSHLFLLAGLTWILALTGAVVLAALLAVLMATDVRNAFQRRNGPPATGIGGQKAAASGQGAATSPHHVRRETLTRT